MSERAPERETYDALIELAPWTGIARRAFAIVKRTYAIDPTGLRPIEPVPLRHDIRESSFDAKWPSGSDFWPLKAATDVVVLGSAHAPRGRKTPRARASLRVGRVIKSALVSGDRVLEWRGGMPRISEPEPFESIPLDLAHAYGGHDPLVTAALPQTFAELLRAASEHPGGYPRNAIGKGYLVLEHERGPVPLPNVEDPDDPLTLERIFARDARRWFAQPLPWTFAWTQPLQFPRSHYLGFEPWFPLPREVELPEVGRGYVPAAWRTMRRNALAGQSPEAVFFQEASYGMSFVELAAKTPLEVSGMHPDRERLAFELPPPPRIEIECEGSRELVATRVLHVVITPDEERVEITWVATRESLPRAFMRGLHGHIPLSVIVDGDRPVEYVTPEPIVVGVRRAEREGRVQLAPSSSSLELGPAVLGGSPPERTRDFLPPSRQILLEGVDVPTGRLLLHRVDFPLQALPLGVERSYSSSMSWRVGTLGPGWSHPLESAVWIEDGWLLYRALDGREVYIAQLPRGELGLREHVHHPIEGVTITRSGADSYRAVRSDGLELQYHTVGKTLSTGAPVARLYRVTSVAGDSLEVRYDVHGQLSELVMPTGLAIRYELDRMGRVAAVLGPGAAGQTIAIIARYEYDTRGQLVRKIGGSGVHSYRYARGRLVAETRPSGETLDYRYEENDGAARCVAVERSGETIAEVLFNPTERVAVAVDAAGNAQSYALDAHYRVLRGVDVQGNESRFAYDAGGLCVSAIDALGRRTDSSFDASGHLIARTVPGGAIERFEHDLHGRLVRHSSADGAATKIGWDARGGISARVEPNGASCVYERDLSGRIASMDLPPEIRIAIEREPQAYATSLRSPLGRRRAQYDTYGRVMDVVDEEGARASVRYDTADRVREIAWGSDERVVVEHPRGGPVASAASSLTRFADGVVDVRMERDPSGRLSALGAGPARVELRRDRMGRVIGVGAHELVLDARGLLEREVVSESAVHHLRDAVGRPVRMARGKEKLQLTYGETDAPTSIRHGRDHEVHLEHTPGGWLRRATSGDRSVAFERDASGRIVGEVAEDELGVRRGYDARGHVVAIDGPGGVAVRVERDASGAWLSVSAGALTLSSVPDGRGYEVKRVLGSPLELRFGRDVWGRCISRRYVWSGAVLSETEYRVRGAGWITRVASSDRGAFDVVHDWRGGVTGLRSATGVELVRELDEAGNVHRARDRSDRRYDERGRLTEADGSSFEYDEAGRRAVVRSGEDVTRYSWSSSGRLASITLPSGARVRLVRDPLDRISLRILEIPSGGVWVEQSRTRFVWDGAHVLATIEGDRVTSWIRVDGALVAKIEGERRFAVVTDPAGTVTELIDETGHLAWRGAVDLFGRVTADVVYTAQPWRWDGHWEDPDTGLQHTLFREYDPVAGVYLAPSPLGLAGGRGPYAPILDPLSSSSPFGMHLDPLFGEEIPLGIEAELTLATLRQLGQPLPQLPPLGHELRAVLDDASRLLLGRWSRWDPILASAR